MGLLALLACLGAFAIPRATAQITVYEANFNSDSNGSSGASPDAWSAATTSSCASMAIVSNAWRFTTSSSNSCVNETAVWTSASIDISSLTNIELSFGTVGNGFSTISVSMTNGSLSGSSFTPNAGATTTQISFTINITKKNRFRSLDDVKLIGTLSCPDGDGDGVCDDDEVDGCTDGVACNYNVAATDDDGTCIYATACDFCSGETDGTGTVVDGSALTPFEFTLTVDDFPEEVAWYMGSMVDSIASVRATLMHQICNITFALSFLPTVDVSSIFIPVSKYRLTNYAHIRGVVYAYDLQDLQMIQLYSLTIFRMIVMLLNLLTALKPRKNYFLNRLLINSEGPVEFHQTKSRQTQKLSIL